MPKTKMNIAASTHRDGDDDEIDEEGDHAARQHALEQFGVGDRIVGVRLDVDRHADAPRVAAGMIRDAASALQKWAKMPARCKGLAALERSARRLRHGLRGAGDAT